MTKQLIGIAAAALSLAVLAGTAAAQDRRAPHENIVQLPDEIIIGRRQRPGAFYVLTRGTDRYEVRELRTSFVRDVVHSVAEGPF
jgi:hypothetical protein